MAKKSAIDKNLKRKEAIEKNKAKRAELAKVLKSLDVSPAEKIKAMKVLDKTSRASHIKYRNRCEITGRPRGYRGKLGLSRNMAYHYASFGMIMGLKKAS